MVVDLPNRPFADGSFGVVGFDTPHLKRLEPKGWQGKKYGNLNKDRWRDELLAGFAEHYGVVATRHFHLQMERNANLS